MITIDGSQGEGGGQVLRSALALSLVTGQAVTVNNIRARRRRPGLMPQHLAAVSAAQAVCRGELEGAGIGSTRLVLRPGTVVPGNYDFRVGTAGSTTLVLQTILPTLISASHVSQVKLEGGTHNPLAPPYDFLAHVYLPLLERMGPRIETHGCVPGFYPAGGGSFQVQITPSRRLESFDLQECGKLVRRHVRALVANLPRHIAERECLAIAEQTDWDPSCFTCEEVTCSAGPGNVVMIQLEFDQVTELFTSFGKRGKRAERVAAEALAEAQRYLAADVPVGEHLADQLMLPLALAAHHGQSGSFRTLPLSGHAATQLELLRQFLKVKINASEGDGDAVVRFTPAA